MRSSGVDTHELAVAAKAQADASKAQADASILQVKLLGRQLDMAFAPNVHVINLMLFPENKRGSAPIIKAGQRLEGEVAFLLMGRQEANITATICSTYWTEKNLPMLRPYNPGGDRNYFDWCVGPKIIGAPVPTGIETDKEIPPPFKMLPGAVGKWEFKTSVPPNYSQKKQSLYVFGYIIFRDPVMPKRYSLFARKYDPGKGRFVTVKDPNYERENEDALDNEEP
jgi:hypothetical protein